MIGIDYHFFYLEYKGQYIKIVVEMNVEWIKLYPSSSVNYSFVLFKC